ncbi:MAG: MBOAT family protein [Kiritimatiellae bacterium]|nr:MBOAT family protein [Kiritimatiellia bacterium]
MLFNSLAFAIFLPLTLGIYWVLRKRSWQNFFLLVVSYIFYGWWDWRYLFLIAGCSLVNYLAGIIIGGSQNIWLRRVMLTLSCLVCLGALCLFKYFNFFLESFASLFALVGIYWSPIVLNIMLPVGISFFTFQALSYTIDVMLGKLKPTRNIVDFFVFISFFPQLVAGPIERATNLLPQFQKKRYFKPDDVMHGLALMVYGLFKKMVVADTLSSYVDQVFENYALYNSTTCLIATFFFAIQIYCDFSGYSDAARGIAKLFGFELMVNFNRPYLSRSFTEFWRRWHISLSTWFKDYLYIPLGGNKVSTLKWLRNLWIVFLVSGLWHGANWTYLFWGALHASYQTIAFIKNRFWHFKPSNSWYVIIWQILFVNVGVCFALIFFRSISISHAFDFIQTIFKFELIGSLGSYAAGTGVLALAFRFLVVGLLFITYAAPNDCKFKTYYGYILFILFNVFCIVFLGQVAGGEFIYFQF